MKFLNPRKSLRTTQKWPHNGQCAHLLRTISATLCAEVTTVKPHGNTLFICIPLSPYLPHPLGISSHFFLALENVYHYPSFFLPISLESSALGSHPTQNALICWAHAHRNSTTDICTWVQMSTLGCNTENSNLIWAILNLRFPPYASQWCHYSNKSKRTWEWS